MSATELLLCVVAVLSSSASQLCVKAASTRTVSLRGLSLLGISGLLMLFSILTAVWVLRTLQLSQLIPFAAGAYVLVPIGSHLFFKEQLQPRFWIGVTSIMVGIYLTIS